MEHSEPKRQHYIPEMLLRNFCNPYGRVWVADGAKVYETHPRNVFVESHLYTRSDFSKVPRGASDLPPIFVPPAMLVQQGQGVEQQAAQSPGPAAYSPASCEA